MKGRQKGDEVNYVEAKDFFKESKRLVIWQPSGEFSQGRLTFTVAVKAGHRDSTLDVNPSASGYGAIRLDDDEMDFELTREDLQINMEDWNAMNFYLQIVLLYLKHRIVFIILLFCDILLETIVLYYTWHKRREIVSDFVTASNGGSENAFVKLYWSFYITDIAVTAGYFVLGLVAIFSERISVHSKFSCYVIVLIFFKLAFTALSAYNLLLMVMKILIYAYAKFIASVIKNILILPANSYLNSEWQ
eukprot:TRINITY_DN1373_c0_g1_i1.p1 TRINITY_DN1373_c0_g1~~TRINITY_DN1373_c0_g1_i1.p1  ORF type:complete len:264 (-),score=57.50 TRINITY_DN1373_c0_g1_i1:97-837(-)